MPSGSEPLGQRHELAQDWFESFGYHGATQYVSRGQSTPTIASEHTNTPISPLAALGTTHRRPRHSSVRVVTLVTVGESVRAALATWPYERDVVQIVLLDHHMIPTVSAVEQWVAEAQSFNPRALRTGALFPEAAAVFTEAGFAQIDQLALLETQLHDHEQRRFGRRFKSRNSDDLNRQHISLHKMRSRHLAEVAALDRTAFGDPWGNDERSLRDVMAATPHHRARIVQGDHGIIGFAISGHSASAGYLQRLAVHPAVRRQGIAQTLVTDALHWMANRQAASAMVNTALVNRAALALYESNGFGRRPESLSILELPMSRSVPTSELASKPE
jgi:ribosomal-protein-alanine N-acetyltransferase